MLFDDRDERPGVKFADAELIGVPYRLTVGPKGLANGVIEVFVRSSAETTEVSTDDAGDAVITLIQADLA